jgi:hypothetical protein
MECASVRGSDLEGRGGGAVAEAVEEQGDDADGASETPRARHAGVSISMAAKGPSMSRQDGRQQDLDLDLDLDLQPHEGTVARVPIGVSMLEFSSYLSQNAPHISPSQRLMLTWQFRLDLIVNSQLWTWFMRLCVAGSIGMLASETSGMDQATLWSMVQVFCFPGMSAQRGP